MTKILAEAELLHPPTKVVPSYPCNLTEGPLWHPGLNKWLLISIDRGRVIVLSAEGAIEKEIRVGCLVGTVGLTSKDDEVVIAVHKGWAILQLSTGAIQFKEEIEGQINTAGNDGKPGPDGAFYYGTKDLDFKKPIGGFYRIDHQGRSKKVFGNLGISNGMDWNLSENKFYHIDSFDPNLYEYDFDKTTGTISNRKVFITLCDGKKFPEALPDGMCIDAEGNLFIAEWGLSRISVWTEKGSLIGYIKTPINRPTCCAFGGKDYKTLLITSERLDGDHSLAGGVFITELKNFQGRAPYRYQSRV